MKSLNVLVFHEISGFPIVGLPKIYRLKYIMNVSVLVIGLH